MNLLRRIERLEVEAAAPPRLVFGLTRWTDAELGRLKELVRRGPETWTDSERAEVEAMAHKYTVQ